MIKIYSLAEDSESQINEEKNKICHGLKMNNYSTKETCHGLQFRKEMRKIKETQQQA